MASSSDNSGEKSPSDVPSASQSDKRKGKQKVQFSTTSEKKEVQMSLSKQQFRSLSLPNQQRAESSVVFQEQFPQYREDGGRPYMFYSLRHFLPKILETRYKFKTQGFELSEAQHTLMDHLWAHSLHLNTERRKTFLTVLNAIVQYFVSQMQRSQGISNLANLGSPFRPNPDPLSFRPPYKCFTVFEGNHRGIFNSWDEVCLAIKDFPNPKYKGFYSETEAATAYHSYKDLLTKPWKCELCKTKSKQLKQVNQVNEKIFHSNRNFKLVEHMLVRKHRIYHTLFPLERIVADESIRSALEHQTYHLPMVAQITIAQGRQKSGHDFLLQLCSFLAENQFGLPGLFVNCLVKGPEYSFVFPRVSVNSSEFQPFRLPNSAYPFEITIALLMDYGLLDQVLIYKRDFPDLPGKLSVLLAEFVPKADKGFNSWTCLHFYPVPPEWGAQRFPTPDSEEADFFVDLMPAFNKILITEGDRKSFRHPQHKKLSKVTDAVYPFAHKDLENARGFLAAECLARNPGYLKAETKTYQIYLDRTYDLHQPTIYFSTESDMAYDYYYEEQLRAEAGPSSPCSDDGMDYDIETHRDNF